MVSKNSQNVLGASLENDVIGERVKEEFFSFLNNFVDGMEDTEMPQSQSQSLSTSTMGIGSSYENEKNIGNEPKEPMYRRQLYSMKNDGYTTLFVAYRHIEQYSEDLAAAVMDEYYRLEPYMRIALFMFVKNVFPEYAIDAGTKQPRQFWLAIHDVHGVYKMRELTTLKLGKLITISGTVTRTSEVRPELYLGTFSCNLCRVVVRNVEQQFRYTEPSICPSQTCGNRNGWTLLPEQSVFIDWQKIHGQENPNEIPQGSMPRGLDIIVRNDLVEYAKPGDQCEFTGCIIVIPDLSQLGLPNGRIESRFDGGRGKDSLMASISGISGVGVRELGYKLAFVACMIKPTTKTSVGNADADHIPALSIPDTGLLSIDSAEIYKIRSTPGLYQKMVNSIAPTVFGHHDIKASILLMLLGGVQKQTGDGMMLRGDINVCIVGDPGTAKSQFLKYVASFLPRSVYTSGKSASAAGLTAAVVKDPETNEFTVEAGALMLADGGVCAIDEFDKMDIADQVAIHEAMEQQTISIAKAGVHASLYARTSVLAAANPIYGRYNRKKSLKQNISLSAPIISRFDLFFVVLDECSEQVDKSIARYILSIHRHQDESIAPEFSVGQLYRYISFAKDIQPTISKESAALLVDKYCQLRQNNLNGVSSHKITVRQLESLVRLSEALAKLHLDTVVHPKYVREAHRLLKQSIIRIDSENIDLTLDNVDVAEIEHNFAVVDIPKDSAVASSPGPDQESTTKATPLSIKFDQYQKIAGMMAFKLRSIADAASNKTKIPTEDMSDRNNDFEDDEGNVIGLSRDELASWYLEQIEDTIGTEEEYFALQKLILSVINRLITKDGILIELTDASEENILIVHPNYIT